MTLNNGMALLDIPLKSNSLISLSQVLLLIYTDRDIVTGIMVFLMSYHKSKQNNNKFSVLMLVSYFFERGGYPRG